jgi:ubiquitin carboxyl-terminal hydrolase 14
VPLDPTKPGSTFKHQILTLTGVPLERQKVVIRGAQLKDEQDMAALKLKPGTSILVIGTAEGGIKAPETRTVFLEDMSIAERAKSVCPSPEEGD